MTEIYLLNNEKFEGILNLDIFEIRDLNPSFAPKNYDAIVFTSKNAVFSIDKIFKEWKNLPAFSIGEGTSATIKKLGGEVLYEAKASYGEAFAAKIAKLLGGKTVLFPRAKEVASDVAGILRADNVGVEEVIVYETACKEITDTFQNDAIFIFTAPSSVKFFLQQIKWRGNFQAIAIGKKTAAAFPEAIKPLISPKPNIEACVNFAKTLSKNYI